MPQRDPSAKRTAILVIDPDRDERESIRRILEPEGIEVREVASPEQAPSALDGELRLVLVASSLGQSAVIALCEELREHSRRSHFAISVMTDAGALSCLDAFDRAGASDFLARPLEPMLFRYRVRCMIRGARHLSDLQRADAIDRLRLAGPAEPPASRARLPLPELADDACLQPTLGRLREALEDDDLLLHYQPKAHADTRRVTGLEALIRWVDAELGAVAPTDFIPIAESSGMILPIGSWVLQTACRQLADWHARGVEVGRVAVNVSPQQFGSPGFVESVLAVIHETGADPRSIELEITEGCLLEGEQACATLSRLRSSGLGIAIDDFGTGYSSLQYLRRLPIDALKIDRAFIRDLESDATARSLVASIISLAWSLELRVVAEGVETEAQWSFLRDHGCDEIQGFALSRALPPQACEAFVRAQG